MNERTGMSQVAMRSPWSDTPLHGKSCQGSYDVSDIDLQYRFYIGVLYSSVMFHYICVCLKSDSSGFYVWLCQTEIFAYIRLPMKTGFACGRSGERISSPLLSSRRLAIGCHCADKYYFYFPLLTVWITHSVGL